MTSSRTAAQDLQLLYVAYFGRPADPGGLDYWIAKGATPKSITAAFYASAEFQSISSGLMTDEKIHLIYRNLFDRQADAPGLSYWSNEITKGTTGISILAVDLIYSVDQPDGQIKDRDVANSRATLAKNYTEAVRADHSALAIYVPEAITPVFVSGPAFAEAAAFLKGISREKPNDVQRNLSPSEIATTVKANPHAIVFKSQITPAAPASRPPSSPQPAIGPPTFSLSNGGDGTVWTLPIIHGNVVVSTDGANHRFTPESGTPVTVAKANVTEVVVPTIVFSGAASDLKSIGRITGAVTVRDTGSVAATDLNTITENTTELVTATAATTITGTASSIATALITNKGNSGKKLKTSDGVHVTITDTISVSDVNAIAAKTTGVVTATLTTGTLASFSALTENGNAYTITVNDAANTALTATALSALGGKTTGTVTVSNAVVISGTAAELTAALVTADTLVVAATASVTVNDAANTVLTATALSALGGKTTGTVTVSNAVVISGSAAELTAALVTADTLVAAANANVTVTNTVSVGDANAIAAQTTGVVTATLATSNLASFSGLAETGNVYTVTVNDAANTALTATALSALGGKTTGTVTVSNAVVISGSAAELIAALVTADTLVVAANANVTVTNAVSVGDANALAAKTTGVLTATLATGNLASFSGLAETGNAYTINVTDTISVSDANALAAKTTGVVTATLTTGNLASFSGLAETGNAYTITVTDTISVGDANALAAKTTGVVTAMLTTGNLASFAGLAETGNAYTVTVNDAANTALTATALSALGGKTTGTVTVSNAVVISGTAAEVTAALVTVDTLVVAANANVNITDSISVSDANAIAAKTTGVVTATLATGNLASFSALAETGNAYTITVNDAANTALTASALSALGGKTTGTVTVSNAVVISGTAAELIAALVTADTLVVAATASVTVNDAANTALTATALSALGGKTTGTVTVSNAVVISGSAAELTAALVTADTLVVAANANVTVTNAVSVGDANALAAKTTGVLTATLATGNLASFSGLAETGNAYTVTVNDAANTALTATALSALGGKTTETVTVSNAVVISGTLAEVTAALLTAESLVVAANANVTVTGTISVSDANAIAAKTTGVVTATLTTGNLASFATLAETGNAYTINVTDTISVIDANALAAKTTGVVTATLTTGNLASFSGLAEVGNAYTITVNDAANTALTATALSAIGAKTTGTVTVSNAVAISGTLAEVTAALVTADSLVVAPTASVTITDGANTAITASALSAIGAKTTGTVTVSNAVAISGTLAEVTAALLTAESLGVAANANVTVTGTISVSDANAIAAKTTGVVTATLTTGNLASFSGLAETGNAYTIAVTDTISVSDANALAAKTTGVVTATLTTGNLASFSGLAEVGNAYTITVTDTISVADANALAAKTTGVLTATLTTGNLASFAGLAETGNAYTVTINDAANTALTATALSALGGKTTGTVTVSNAVVISGTAAEVTAALVTPDTLVVAANANVNITGTIRRNERDAIAAKTTGVVTATIQTDTIQGTANRDEFGWFTDFSIDRNITLLGGDDVVRYDFRNQFINLLDTIDGGDGTDELVVEGWDWQKGTLTIANDNNLRNVERIIVISGRLDLTGQTEGFTLNGHDEFNREATIVGGSGNDSFGNIWETSGLLSGGGGNDSFYIGLTWKNDPSNANYHNSPNSGVSLKTIDGGTGTDTLTFGGATFMKFQGDEYIVNVEQIQLAASQTGGPLGSGAVTSADLSNQSESFTITGSTGHDSIIASTGNDTISSGNSNDTVSGGAGNDQLTGGAGADRFVLQTDSTRNGFDTILDFTIADSDHVFIDFGKPGGLASNAALRGSGAFFQRLAQGSAINANTGLIISLANISDSAGAKTYAEGLVGALAGDIVYLIGSTNAAGSANTTLYRVDYTTPNAATVTSLASLGQIAVADLTSNNFNQFAPISTQVNFTERLIEPGNRVQLGGYWPNADGQFGTIAGYDQIAGFSATDGTKQILRLPGNAYIAPEVTNADGLNSGLTYRGNANWLHTITSAGRFTGSHPIEGDNHAAMMIDYLSQNDIGDAGATVFFTTNYTAAVRGSINHTWIYTQTGNNRGRAPTATNQYEGGFTVVNLIGVTLQGLETIPSANDMYAVISSLKTGTLASLSGLADTGNPYTVTVNDAADTALAATALSALGAKTKGAVTVSNAVVISGTAAELAAALINADTLVVAANAKVTVTDIISVADANAIAAKTTGVVTATLAAGDLASFSGLAETGNAYTITINDAANTALTASALSALGGKTTAAVTVSNAVEITGTAAEVTAALVTADTLVVAANAKVTVTGTITPTQFNAIRAKTNGVITANIEAETIQGTNNRDELSRNTISQDFTIGFIFNLLGGDDLLGYNVHNRGIVNSLDTIDGGDGADEIIIEKGFMSFSNNNALKNTEVITVLDAESVRFAVPVGVDLTGQTESFTLRGGHNWWQYESITGGSGNDIFNNIVGADVMRGGDGNDRFNVTTTGNPNDDTRVSANAIIDGGAGTDTIEVAANAVIQYAGDANIINIENIILGSGVNVNLSNQTEGFVVTGSNGIEVITAGTGNDTLSGGDGADVLSGRAGNDQVTGGGGADQFILQTSNALNGIDTFTDFNLAQGDTIRFDFGQGANLANLNALRGNGAFYQRLAAGGTINNNSGLLISTANINDSTAAKTYAEGLAGALAGDIVYLIGSTNAGGNGNTTLYRIDYSAPNAATVTTIADLGNIDISSIAQTNINQFSLAPTQTAFQERVIAPGNRVLLGGYWPNNQQFGTIQGYDQITNFGATDGIKQILQLPGNAYIAPSVTNFDGLDSALTYGGNAYWTHSISATGKLTSNHPPMTDNHVAALIDYLSHNDIGDAGATVFFTVDYSQGQPNARGSNFHTWIYTQTGNDRGRVPVATGNALSENVYQGGYTVVDLIGVTLQGLETLASGNDMFGIIA